MNEEIVSCRPGSRDEWRKWLQKNHNKHDSVWLIYYKKSTSKSSLTWDEAVEEALCFGWIDSKRQTLDHESFRQFFGKRKAKGTWSKINKARIERLINEGRMTKAGLDAIESAKQNGSWTLLDDVDELNIPADLAKAFRKVSGSKKYFSTLARSYKRILLQWLVMAKRPETRQKRLDEIAKLAGKGEIPKQFRPVRKH